jgi:hypothetical protein
MNPLYHVSPEFLYSSDVEEDAPGEACMPDQRDLELVRRVLDRTKVAGPAAGTERKIQWKIGPNLEANGEIPGFDIHVIFRILWNLIKNSTAAAEKFKKVKASSRSPDRQKNEGPPLRPEILIDMELDAADHPRQLRMTVTDNCGGQLLPGMPKRITCESWSAFLRDNGHFKGVGFFFIAKYCAASRGSFTVSKSNGGVVANIVLGLKKPGKTARH